MSLIEVIGIVSICVLIPALVIGFFMSQWHGFNRKDYLATIGIFLIVIYVAILSVWLLGCLLNTLI